MALADVNGDGILDLIAIKEQAPDLAVFLGHGDGTFGPMIRIFNSSPGPVRVAVADLDRNGVLDLAIAESRASAVPIFLGNGDGTFLTAPPLEVVTRQLAVAIADLDADGILDVVTGYCDFDVVEQNVVTVLLRNSDGSLRSRSTTRVGECVNSVAVADVNGDGHLDVVSGNRGGSHPPDYGFNISVLLGNGDGTLRHAAVHPSGVGQDTTSIALADVNHDGKPDLVLVNGFDQDGWALLGQGDGTFTIHQHLLLPGEPKAVALADMNGDGYVDMLVANFGAKTLAVWLGQSDGSFLEP